MSQVRKWPKTTKLLIYPLSSHVGIKISWLNRATLSVSGVRCCHTEQRGAICCTLPMSIRSCLMWRFSWGSLARGSGGSSSPVKSSQLSRTEREKRTNIHMATAQTVRKRYNQKAEKVMEKESTSLSLGSHCAQVTSERLSILHTSPHRSSGPSRQPLSVTPSVHRYFR